jgi:hypothetical protein
MGKKDGETKLAWDPVPVMKGLGIKLMERLRNRRSVTSNMGVSLTELLWQKISGRFLKILVVNFLLLLPGGKLQLTSRPRRAAQVRVIE